VITFVRDRPRLRIVRDLPKTTDLWNLHSHSKYSTNDALSDVSAMVAWAKGQGQPALGLTDHGNMAGTVKLYKAAKGAGIKPFPGAELYIVRDREAYIKAVATDQEPHRGPGP
jgi:DNA polymerase III alpha subunit